MAVNMCSIFYQYRGLCATVPKVGKSSHKIELDPVEAHITTGALVDLKAPTNFSITTLH